MSSPRVLLPFSACPLPALAPPSFGWSYARWLRCAMPGARVIGAGLVGEYGDSNPTVPPRHQPGRRVAYKAGPWCVVVLGADAAPGVRHHPYLRTWVTCWRNGYLCLILYEIRRPVGLLDGGVELAPLAGELVHPAPQGSYLYGGQDTDLRPPVARHPV